MERPLFHLDAICYPSHMTGKSTTKRIQPSLRPAKKDVQNLLDMFEFFLTERQLGKPIEELGESVRDMRLIIGRLLADHFLGLEDEEETRFCSALALMLADRCQAVPMEGDEDRKYVDYCIAEILTCFEQAQEIKAAYPDDPVFQKILALDVPILRPFDYGLRDKLRLIKSGKKRRVRHK